MHSVPCLSVYKSIMSSFLKATSSAEKLQELMHKKQQEERKTKIVALILLLLCVQLSALLPRISK